MEPTIDRLRIELKAMQYEYFDHPDVVCLGLGEKFRDNRNTKEPALIFFVREKLENPERRLPTEVMIPAGSENAGERVSVQTDVVEIREELALLSSIDGADGIRSALTLSSGTLGLVLRDEADAAHKWAITNAHVIARIDDELVGFEVLSDAFGIPEVRIGVVATYTKLSRSSVNYGDLALIELDPDLPSRPDVVEPWGGSPVVAFLSLSESKFAGSRRAFFYASGRDQVWCENPRLIAEYDIGLGDGGRLRYGMFHILDLHPESPQQPHAGHSGSLLVTNTDRADALYGAGIVIGGGDRFVLAFSWMYMRPILLSWRSSLAV